MAEGFLKTPFDLAGKKIWVAGATGMVGSAVVRRLQQEIEQANTTGTKQNQSVSPSALTLQMLHNQNIGEKDTVLEEQGREREGSRVFDLREQQAVRDWMHENRPDVVVLAAARVGGILANQRYPADFLYDNMMIQSNVIHAAYKTGVEKLLFLGSSCIYPKEAPQPIKEDSLLSGPLEVTNEAYALAKIAGIKLCQAYRRQYGCDFISAMPCNLYGPGDNFDRHNSHVVGALIRKFHAAVESGADTVEVWGTGRPRREFLYVDDLAGALVFLLKHYSHEKPVNIGAGHDISIKELAETLADVAGFKGKITYDRSKPDGAASKLMDSSRIMKAGWRPDTELKDGLQRTYHRYQGCVRAAKAA